MKTQNVFLTSTQAEKNVVCLQQSSNETKTLQPGDMEVKVQTSTQRMESPNSDVQSGGSCHTAAKGMRRPGIEPGSHPWQGCMIPLHHRRLMTGAVTVDSLHRTAIQT